MTALKSLPNFLIKRKRRTKIRLQHLLNREHPTGTEQKSLNYECGWKGGDRGGLAARKKKDLRKHHSLLTSTGLLMEGPCDDFRVADDPRVIVSWSRKYTASLADNGSRLRAVFTMAVVGQADTLEQILETRVAA